MNPAGSDLVINEVFPNGGGASGVYTHDFVELYNPTASDITLSGQTLQYRSQSGTAFGQVVPLTGTVPAEGHFLVQVGNAGTGGTAIPVTPNQTSGSPSLSATNGTLALAPSAAVMPSTPGDLAGSPAVIDVIGWGSPSSFETAPSAAGTNTETLNRTDAADTDDNLADFGLVDPTPTNAAGDTPPPPQDPPPSGEPTAATIAEIQGTGASSPLVGEDVVTRGVVTAAYPTGGIDGFYIQTEGTGGALDETHDASDGLFVYDPGFTVAKGDHVEVTGEVSEFFGLTQVVPGDSGRVAVLTGTPEPVQPATVAFAGTDTEREVLEGMLLAPQGDHTVTNTFNSGNAAFGEIGLATGAMPLRAPTDDARPGTPAYNAIVADNAERRVLLDDGATINFLGSDANKDIPLPYFTGTDAQVRVGADVTFTDPVILSFGFGSWRLQPTAQVTNGDVNSPVTFERTRTPAPEAVGGDLTLAAFNVLNYFTSLGEDEPGCESFDDRDGNPIVTDFCTVRGAYTPESFQRQQAKIVNAINALDADVVALQEIENSEPFTGNRDDALINLVIALNADAGRRTWQYVPSPKAVPEGEDVIRTAFIFKRFNVERVGPSRILLDDPAFSNARQPLAQAFRPRGGAEADTFLAIANHFKSKSCGGATGDNADARDGQACFNGDRTRQAQALVTFADTVSGDAGIEKIFLLGDFNSYTEEDPLQVFEQAGWTNVAQTLTDKDTYSFAGLSGSLDHVFASPEAFGEVTGADIWNINSGESPAYEYSRFNYNITNLYDESPYRSSDHDPIVVGIDTSATTEVNLLNINDFHGRIDSNTVKFAGTIEQLREEGGEDNTLFLAAGDNIGASLFASAVAQDQPTIDVLNALEMDAAAVGNHEFDQGYDDLVGRVSAESNFPLLGANVYDMDTGERALDAFSIHEVAGLSVGVIGVVTQETPTLVTPSGIEGLQFRDPVAEANLVAQQIEDRVDVIVVEYHEGASGSGTLEEEVADSEVFAEIVNETDASVDAIFNGHTSQQYAFQAPVPGEAGKTRPVLQAGDYGAFVGQVELKVDNESGEVTSSTAENIARTTVANDVLIASYPRVAEVNEITQAALAAAAEIGNQPIGEIANDITTAFIGGSYGPDGYAGGVRDDRASESTLGNLVASALRDKVGETPAGEGAQIGVVNPGGLRSELLFDGNTTNNPENADGVVTFAEANAVLPFTNQLFAVTLTGAEFVDVLEQQWQRDAQGNVPSRPYLQLNLSDNVSYTFDETMPEGERITSVIVDGQPLDPTVEYKVATFSFLATGGDNFRAFTEGTAQDTGLVDRDAWIEYLREQSDVAPIAASFERRSVRVGDQPSTVVPGEDVSFEVGATAESNRGSLNLTSLGSPANTSLSVGIVGADTPDAEPAPVGDFPVTDGAAAVTFTVPAEMAADEYLIVMTASPSGTEVVFPVTVEGGEEPGPAPSTTTATAPVATYGKGALVRVRVESDPQAGGTVEIRKTGRLLGTGTLFDGRASVRLGDRALEPGTHTLNVRYLGSDTVAASRTTVDVRVLKAPSQVTAEVTTPRVVVDRTRAQVRVGVTAAGLQPFGRVVLRSSGRELGAAFVRQGQVTLRLETFKRTGVKTVVVRYLGNAHVEASSSTFPVRVVSA
ncbi:MAG: ExeM/NucH family extracellular endonuclease [Actinomycetota bacterium]|nr:ExeM/NucH family extracellular endonuclease [Actinomycetota bacterium]